MGTLWIPMGIHGTIASIFTLHENKIKNQPRKCIVGVNGGEDVVFFPPFLLRNTPTIKTLQKKVWKVTRKPCAVDPVRSTQVPWCLPQLWEVGETWAEKKKTKLIVVKLGRTRKVIECMSLIYSSCWFLNRVILIEWWCRCWRFKALRYYTQLDIR